MKRFAIIAGLLVAFVAVMVVVAPLVVSSEAVRRQVTTQIADWTGRAVTFQGKPTISLMPYPTIRIGEVTLANAHGMGDQPFMRMDALVGRIRLLPLLIGRIEIAEFRLVRPNIALQVGTNGRVNWLMKDGAVGVQAAETDPPLPVGKPEAHATPPTVALGEFVIDDGVITFDDARLGRFERLTNVNLDVRWPATTEPAVASGSLSWRGETVQLNGAIAAPIDVMAGGSSGMTFQLVSKPLRISFTGKALRLRNFQVEGDVKVSSPSVREAITWTGTAMGDGPILGAASISGKMNWIGHNISFDGATVELDGNSGNGVLSINYDGDRPTFQGTLDFKKLDLSPYLKAVQVGIRAAGSWPVAPIHLPIVSACNLDLRVSAGQVLVGAAHIDKAAGAANIRDGRISLTLGDGQLYGGHVSAEIAAEMHGSDFVGNAQAKLDKVPAKQALTDLVEVNALDGTASADVTANVHGRSWGELAETLTGSASISVVNGSLSGIGVADLAKQLTTTGKDGSAPSGGATSFKALAGTLEVAESTVSTSDLHAEGDGFAVDIVGSASLYSALVDGVGTLSLAASDSKAKAPTIIPFAIGGTVRQPVFMPRANERMFRRSSLDRPVRATSRVFPRG